MSLISFENVRFCYDDICAVNGANFDVRRGEILTIVGPNGGGKSTLLKLMAGIMQPESGVILRETGVGYVGQNPDFDVSFPITVRELALMGTLDSKISPIKRYSVAQKAKADEALSRVGLAKYAGRSISQLSGGQLKRAVIARALACDAGVIAFDEPDASLDADAASQLYELLSELRKVASVVIVSHNFRVALDIADRAIYVNREIRLYDEPKNLKERLEEGILL